MQKHMQNLMALLVGFIFALGLGISGMTQPQKVIGFLTLGPGWDPSLIFVMLAAIPIHAIAYFLFRQRKSPLFDSRWHLPTKNEINKPLIAGAVIFGFGWGLGGYCPGPAVTAVGGGSLSAVVFVLSMLSGMLLFRMYDRVKERNKH